MILSASSDRRRLAPWISVAASLLTTVGIAADPWANVKPRPETMVGSLSCMSASCHGADSQAASSAFLSRQFVHWLGTTAKYSDGRKFYDPRARLQTADADPHAVAAQRMLEPRFQDVLRRASMR